MSLKTRSHRMCVYSNYCNCTQCQTKVLRQRSHQLHVDSLVGIRKSCLCCWTLSHADNKAKLLRAASKQSAAVEKVKEQHWKQAADKITASGRVYTKTSHPISSQKIADKKRRFRKRRFRKRRIRKRRVSNIVAITLRHWNLLC